MNTKIVWETRPDNGLVFADRSVEFLRREFQPEGIEEVWFDGYFQWKLGAVNPAGKGYLSVGIADGEVIATISLTKKKILLNGKEYIAAEFGDAYCSERFFNDLSSYIPKEDRFQGLSSSHYLNKSIFGRIAFETTRRALDDGIRILYGTPNQNAFPSWVKRLGHFKFQEHPIYSVSRPTYRFLIARYKQLQPFSKLLKLLDTSLSYLVKQYLQIRARKKITLEESVPSESEINNLWELTKPAFGFSFVRDFAYWEYRYFKHPLKKYRTVTLKSGNIVCGFVIICIQKVDTDSYCCNFVEWMVLPAYSLAAVLADIIVKLRYDSINQFVSYANFASGDGNDFKSNFFRKRFPVNITFYQTDLINPFFLKNMPFQFYMGSTDAL
jgi:hypothetical protein